MHKYPSVMNFILIFMSLGIALPILASSLQTTEIITFVSDHDDQFLPHKLTEGCINGACALVCFIIKLQMDRKLTTKV